MNAHRAALAAAVALVALATAPRAAHAYPEFQFSTGNTRCNMCHFAPDGGGLINTFGRFAAGNMISRGGDGSFMHGLVDEPGWLSTGADLRAAATMRDRGSDPSYALFPMQGDIYTNLRAGDFSATITLGLRAQVRGETSYLSRLVSREHYAMWRPSTTGLYARAGRYFPTYGLRTVDHTSYTRRYLGAHSLQEKYALGGGLVENDWEVHVNGYVPAPVFPLDLSDPAATGRRASGGALYYERRVGRRGSYGVQSKVDFTSVDARYLAGAVGKWYFDEPGVLLMGQLDFGRQTFDIDAAPGRNQLLGHLGASYFPIEGLMVGAAVERYDADLAVGAHRDALRLSAQFFPRAHWEIMAMAKLEAQGGDYGSPATLGMLMLHYYL